MFDKQIKKMKTMDMALVKLGSFTFIMFLMGIWPAFKDWTLSVNPWYFLGFTALAAIFVSYRIFKK